MKKQNFLTLIVFSLFVLFVSSCAVSKEKADASYEAEEYAVAANLYQQFISNGKDVSKPDRQDAAFKIAEAYRQIHDPKNALKWYEKATRYGVKDPIIIYRVAQMKKQQGRFEEAIEGFKKYQKEVPSDPNTDIQIKGCEQALLWKEQPSRYKVNSFKQTNESKFDDFSPMWADRKQKSIMWASDRPEGVSKYEYPGFARPYTDVWVIKLEGRRGAVKWGNPEIVEGLNSDYNDGAMTFTKRMNIMYLTQCNGEKGKEPTCKIYQVRKVGKTWKKNPEPLPFCKDNRWNYGHPALADGDKTLYFASDRPGGYGDTMNPERTKDLWMVKYVKRGKTWGEPINLGPQINTEENEMFPYVHSDGTLYFSSNGHPGVGGLDIYSTTKSGEGPEDWNDPSNMKSPINSSYDDFGIIMDATKEHGYFTSDRKKEKDDIYEFFMDPIVCTLKGQVTDCDSGTAIVNALVEISNNIDSSKIRLKTDSKGYYETKIGINTEYTIAVSKRGDYYYDAEPQYVSTVGVENSLDCQHVKDFCMRNTCNDVFVLPIYYDLAQDYIRADAKPVLDDLIKKLKKYPRMAVEMGSHTDCRASYEYNRDLSQRRANQAVKYLVETGKINPFRLEARGYGESQLVNHCECEKPNINVPCDEDEHQKNRRTTVKVVNCNFDVLSIGVDYEKRNEAALNGKGSLYSPYLLEQQRKYLTETKGNIDSFLNAKRVEDSLIIAKEKEEKFLAMYDFIPLTESRGNTYVYGKVGRKRVKFIYDGEERRTRIPQEMVVQFLTSKTITVDNFKDQGDKIKLSNGMKIFGTSFTLPELKIGDSTFTDVKCKMIEERKPPVLGYNVFEKKYVDFEIKEGKIWLLKDDEDED